MSDVTEQNFIDEKVPKQDIVNLVVNHRVAELESCQNNQEKIMDNFKWRRYRFKTKSVSDWRPLIFDKRFPCWCSGYAGDESYATIVMWLPETEDLSKYYDDAFEIDYTEHESITFSDRFPKPAYFIEYVPDEVSESPKVSPVKEIIYMASPYTHKDPAITLERVKKVSQVVGKLTAERHIVISPIVYGEALIAAHPMPNDWDFWRSFCLSFLMKASKLMVLKLPGWEESTGVKGEIEFATLNGLEIIYIDDPAKID